MHNYRRLLVWKKAHELTLRVYRSVPQFHRRYPSMSGQMTRAAHSIPANIAEGAGRSTGRQFAQALQVAIGSARELDYFLQLAVDLEAIPRNEHATLEARADEITRMLVALRATVMRKDRVRPAPRVRRTAT